MKEEANLVVWAADIISIPEKGEMHNEQMQDRNENFYGQCVVGFDMRWSCNGQMSWLSIDFRCE